MKDVRWNWKRWPFALAAFLLAGLPALAHEKWFVDEFTPHVPAPALFREPTVFGVSIVLLAAAVMCGFWWYEHRYRVARHPGFLKRYLENAHVHARVVLCVTIGVMLMGAGLQRTFLSPSLILPETAYGTLLSLAQISLGSLFIFITPLFAELGAALILLFLAGLPVLPFWDLMEEVMFIGVAIFFMTSEQGRMPWKRWNTVERERLGYHAMRLFVGANFMVLASVKWLRPDLAMTLVDQYHLNFMAAAGMTTPMFVFCAAVAEVCIALAILLKVAMRPALVAAFSLFMLTIYVLGFRELLGHLPIKSTLFILFLLGDWKKGEKRFVR